MSELQRWVWTTAGMEPYRAHPLMPDVGGVFVSAEEYAAQRKESHAYYLKAIEYEHALYGDPGHGLGLVHVCKELIADRDRWRTWAGKAKATLEDIADAPGAGYVTPCEKHISEEARATLATYPMDGDSP